LAVYQVIKYGEDNGILREKAKGITAITPSINKLLDDLRDTMYSYKGVGLAAPADRLCPNGQSWLIPAN